jgi:hypothetical protein
LPEGLPPVASLDPVMIPKPLRGWAVDVSERMQIPLDFAATGAVVVAGSLIGRKRGIYPKRFDDWLVVPNLWGALVGRPSLMKSPALGEDMKPLGRLVAEAYKAFEKATESYEMEAMVAEAAKAALKGELKEAAKEAASSRDRSKLDEIASRSKDIIKVPEKPISRRYKTEDATVEKISEILLENPKGILVHRDELSGWLSNLEKQGREGDRAFYLESWNGTGSFAVDRIGRGSLHIPALCLSILGAFSQDLCRPTSTRPPGERRETTACCSAFSCWCGPILPQPGATLTADPTQRRGIKPTRSLNSWAPLIPRNSARTVKMSARKTSLPYGLRTRPKRCSTGGVASSRPSCAPMDFTLL